MTGRRVPWWGWALVAAPWAAGLVWAAALVGSGAADREVGVSVPATVAVILAGSVASVVAAVVVAAWRQPWTAPDRAGPGAAPDQRVRPDQRVGPHRLLNGLDREVAPRLALLRDLVGTVRAAAERGRLAPRDVTALATVGAEVDDLSTLLAELRTLTDLEAQQSEPGPGDVGAVLVDVAVLVTESPGLDGRRLVPPGERGAATALALGDRDLLFLALHKIVLNALVFSRPGDTVALRAYDDGADVVVEVSDTGPGIPADEMHRVWDPFARGGSAGTTRGAGLGLTVARAAVEQHGGTVRARSREGLGTVVTVVLPAAPRGR